MKERNNKSEGGEKECDREKLSRKYYHSMDANGVTFISSQVPLGGLTWSPKFQSGGMFREGWALVVTASLYGFAIMGKKSSITLFKPLTIIFSSHRILLDPSDMA